MSVFTNDRMPKNALCWIWDFVSTIILAKKSFDSCVLLVKVYNRHRKVEFKNSKNFKILFSYTGPLSSHYSTYSKGDIFPPDVELLPLALDFLLLLLHGDGLVVVEQLVDARRVRVRTLGPASWRCTNSFSLLLSMSGWVFDHWKFPGFKILVRGPQSP